MTRTKLYNLFCIIITMGFIACSVFIFPNAVGRIIEGFRDIGTSLVFFFAELFGFNHNIIPTVIHLPKTPFFNFLENTTVPSIDMPDSFEGFKSLWNEYWIAFGSRDNFISYVLFLINVLYYLSYFVLIAMPFFVLLRVLFKRFMLEQNNNYNVDSNSLIRYKAFSKKVLVPCKNEITLFLSFIASNKIIFVWLFIWLLNFNIITIGLEFFAFYFYFVSSFDFLSIYIQVYKLFLDLSVPLSFIPLWCWCLVGLSVFLNMRKNIALAMLRRFELRNRGFLNERPIVTMVCGTMGKKKTTSITDMALSQEVILREKALEKLLENDLKFPYFPFINLENAIKIEMNKHRVYNLATCRKYVKKQASRWQKNPTQQNIYNYDFNRYGLYVVDIWEVLEIYAQLYFIYVIQSSLILSNYSIRTDNQQSDLGNFPLWHTDFFSNDSRSQAMSSRHSHILDFDSLRLGKRLLDKNRNRNMFEFGVVVITEVGKERGNNLELREVKKNCDEANQKNDLFNAWLKMIRHSATVDSFPFVKVITDEQRPSSWGVRCS